MSKTERQTYKIAGPATWELIRAAYLGGDSARALAERFGVCEHAIRKRINVEGWSKRDYALALQACGIVREKQKPNFIEEGVLREEEIEQREVTAWVQEKRARELELVQKFRYAAHLAYCMVHNPKGAPPFFVDAIAAVRREAFGEGDEESLAAARQSAKEARRCFNLDEEAWEAAFEATADGLSEGESEPALSIPSPFEGRSDCLMSQAPAQAVLLLSMALRMVRSLRMAATRATFGSFPAWRRRA